jgi:hypothetical protein
VAPDTGRTSAGAAAGVKRETVTLLAALVGAAASARRPCYRQALAPVTPRRLRPPRHRITPAARQAGCEAVQARSNQKAADLASIIVELKTAGITRLSDIAAALNERGIPTARGSGRWYYARK